MNDNEFALVKTRLRDLTGLDLEAYKGVQMRRRLDSYLGRTAASSWPELLGRLERQPKELGRLRDFLTINVSSFFRDRQKWEELHLNILPRLVQRGCALRVWSAACSDGSEAYSLAMLLEQCPEIARYRVLGTDIDDGSLKRARDGGPYPVAQVKDVPPQYLAKYFRKDQGERGEGERYWVLPALQTSVMFQKQDLLSPAGNGLFDLVVCRNVLIYFTEEAKDQVIAGLAGHLRRGGILFIGATENIPGGHVPGLERVGLSFYQKVGGGIKS